MPLFILGGELVETVLAGACFGKILEGNAEWAVIAWCSSGAGLQ
jgi:hypothetical protein